MVKYIPLKDQKQINSEIAKFLKSNPAAKRIDVETFYDEKKKQLQIVSWHHIRIAREGRKKLQEKQMKKLKKDKGI